MKSEANKSMYTIWSLAIVLCLLLAVFALVFSSCSKDTAPSPTPAQTLEPSPPPDATAPPLETEAPAQTAEPVAAWLLGPTEDAGTEYIDKMVFLGDSTTYGLKYYGVLTDNTNTKQVWTPSSGTLTLAYHSTATIVYPDTNEEITIVEAVKAKKPEYLVVTLGVNGVSFMDEEYFSDEYQKLIESIQQASPDTRIICNSIYPVASNYEHLNQINNERITAANGWIQTVAEACGVKYADTSSVLVGDDGFMLTEYNSDGIHMNGSGYAKVLEYLRTHAWE